MSDILRTGDSVEKMGLTIDRLDSITHGINLPMPADFHVTQLKIILPEIVADMKNFYAQLTGEDPWGTHPDIKEAK